MDRAADSKSEGSGFDSQWGRYTMTDKEKEEQRINWVYGNLVMENPDITKEDIIKAAEKLLKRTDGQ